MTDKKNQSKQQPHDADGVQSPKAVDVEHIIGFEALYWSMLKCKKGVLWKDSTASYYLNGIERSINLSRQLHDGTYKPKPVTHFRITSPKPREIASITFRDRAYQRSLNDNSIYPTMTASFIPDNFACQKDKGTDAARERLKEFLRKYYRKHGPVGYVMQFDIAGYYPHMNHEVAEATFQRKLPPAVYAMTKRILHEQYKGTEGYNPGSQLIQIAGISVLDRMDHFVKEQLRAKFYIRYMDDFLIIHHDKDYLSFCRKRIEDVLTTMKFKLNAKKTHMHSMCDGIGFLGFDFYLTDTGKVLMFVKPKLVKNTRKKLFRLVEKSKRGGIPKKSVDASYEAWRNHASKGTSTALLRRMDAYYTSLWR